MQVLCEMDTIMGDYEKHNLFVIEDALVRRQLYKGKALERLVILRYSFHETKKTITAVRWATLINDPI